MMLNFELDQFLAPGTAPWCIFASLTLFGRAADLLSTWIGTPNLALEANPFARKLGWRYGVPFNILLALGFACWPFLAVSLTTTSLLVSARNFQYAWMMRAMGELSYRRWFTDCALQSRWWFVVGCHLAEAAFFGLLGVSLMAFGELRIIPFSMGLGICGYATAVAFYTTLTLWRLRG